MRSCILASTNLIPFWALNNFMLDFNALCWAHMYYLLVAQLYEEHFSSNFNINFVVLMVGTTRPITKEHNMELCQVG